MLYLSVRKKQPNDAIQDDGASLSLLTFRLSRPVTRSRNRASLRFSSPGDSPSPRELEPSPGDSPSPGDWSSMRSHASLQFPLLGLRFLLPTTPSIAAADAWTTQVFLTLK
ncbi:hypothetical protein U9M48_043585 [Paspalum notatum var. saurae]|uniref:Uncharacterized protein n=1 Tax=Paspalum notatum var. saurae TaxID=547442 RepID=A0AAQ3UX69_PASNO